MSEHTPSPDLAPATPSRGEAPARYLHHYGAEDHASLSGATFEATDPTTGAEWSSFAEADVGDVELAVSAARAAFERSEWSSLSPTRRGRLMMRLADAVGERAEDLARLETQQNGKLLKEMSGQLRVVPDWLYYFGGLADKIEGAVVPLDRQTVLNYTLPEPVGVVGVILPWNSPMLVAAMGVAPALAAGCTVVIKPSEFASASVIEFARIATEVGVPPGVINVVTGGATSGKALVSNPGVDKVTFTGSTAAGRSIAASLGERLGRYLLELGGKSANIVFSDANLDAAEAGVLAGIFAAGGQSCIAGSRLLVHKSIHDELVERLVTRARQVELGDPFSPNTQMGPVATRPQLSKIEGLVSSAVDEGADVVVGGSRAHLRDFPGGLFYEPTILCVSSPTSTIAQEEVFGPVLTVIPFETDADAVAIANSSQFGLAAGVWTENIKRAHNVARQLRVGTVWVNLYRALTFNSPFGGYKNSGIGRENGKSAVDEYLQTKSVWCELSSEIQDPFVLNV